MASAAASSATTIRSWHTSTARNRGGSDFSCIRSRCSNVPAGSAVTDALDYRRLFEESPDVLLVLRPDAPRFTMVAATRARHAVTHTTDEQVLGKGLFDAFPDDPGDPAATGARNLRASLDRVLATRAPDTMAVQRYDIPDPSGQFVTRYWSPKNIPILDSRGEVELIFHRVEDITELVRASEVHEPLLSPSRKLEREVVARSRELSDANESLRDAAARLQELDRAKTEFFSNVSHEFRTPLTLMLGPLEDALADGAHPLAGGQRQRIVMAHSNSLRLLKLVNALLDFSRLQAGRHRATFAPLDIGEATAELGGMFESAVSQTLVRLVIDCPRVAEPVWVDRDMWEKIVLNLVSNAFKFTQAGEISVRVRPESDRVVLEVADTGIGIPAEELPRIFERFHRVAGVAGRTHEGSGIGLALVKELVELHGGRVGVTSIVGTGTTVRVEILKGFEHLPTASIVHAPADPGSSREAGAHLADAERWLRGTQADTVDVPGPVGAGGSRARILVIDDNADLRDYMSTLLAPVYAVTTATNGDDGLAAVRREPPDLIVSDVMMPGLTGTELVRELRADPAIAMIPVILVSARAGEESAIEGLDSGADDYLIKPFSAQELLARVRTHVQQARARRTWIEELESANRELDAFTYSVAHDLRAPLRAITGFTEILLEHSLGQLDEDGQRHLRTVSESGLRMGQLIDDLLELSRVTRGELARSSVDLSALVRSVAERLREANPARNVELVIADDIHADADPRLLRIVLENLLGNAWKFTGKKQSARIEFGVPESGEVPAYFVRDNGAGFDPTYAAKLFGVFQRLHTQSEFEGTGVGLATVMRIIKRHHGRVWAESHPDQGATFYFSLSRPSTGVADGGFAPNHVAPGG